MSKKDYTAIAREFNTVWRRMAQGRYKVGADAFDVLVIALSEVFKEDNRLFDKERFERAVYDVDTKR